jgi:division protein CdvB (Snf7/Vps24/ESCRT-III family)
MMGKNKTKKKEVIDEIDTEEDIIDDGLDQNTIEGITEKYNEVLEEKGIVTDQDIQRIADQFPFTEKSSIMDYLVEYGSETEPNL